MVSDLQNFRGTIYEKTRPRRGGNPPGGGIGVRGLLAGNVQKGIHGTETLSAKRTTPRNRAQGAAFRVATLTLAPRRGKVLFGDKHFCPPLTLAPHERIEKTKGASNAHPLLLDF